MKKLIRLSLLTLSVSHAQTSHANEHTLQDELSYLHAESYVYSASKYSQSVAKAPASISIVTAEQIKKYGYRDFGDILASLRSFYQTYDRTYGFIGVRGFSVPSDFNSRLLLLIDGHRFNDTIYDSFDSAEAFPLDIDAIERVEVVRGPGSSLYGSNAVFGVINVISKRGKDSQGGSVKTSYGSFNAKKTSFTAGQAFSNGVEALVTGSFYNSDGHAKLYFKEFDDPSTHHGISRYNDENQSKKLMTKLSFADVTLQGLFLRRDKAIPTASFESVFNNPNQTNTEERLMINGKYDHTFANQLNLQARLSYNNYHYHGGFPYDYGAPSIDINQDRASAQWWLAETQLSKVFYDSHLLTLGGEFQDNFQQQQSSYDSQTHFFFNTSTYRFAFFLQDDISLTEHLTLNAGVRFDYFSNFGDTINPRAGLIYDFLTDNTVKFLYGSAFRAPNQSELNYSGTGIITNPNLQPERFKTLELIVEHRFNEYLHSEINLFHTNMTNLIQYSFVGNNVQQNLNIGNVQSNGIEAQLEGNWAKGWQGRFSYSWQETTNQETHQRLSNSPQHQLKLNLIAPLAGKLFLGFETRYMSRRNTLHSSHVPDYVLSNLTLFSRDWGVKGLELSGSLYNLFNQHYFDPAALDLQQNAIQQDGLTFRIKAGLDF